MSNLNIPEKFNHPLAIEQMQQYGEKYFLKATEVNKIVASINDLIPLLNTVIAIGQKQSYELTTAIPIPEIPNWKTDLETQLEF